MLLEHLTEVISNQQFIEYCEDNIFIPLNMSNTSFYFRDFKRSLLATSYHNFGNFYIRIPFIDIPYGVGGIKCSIEDLSHYAIVHMNGGVYNGNRILDESTVELMHSIQFENDPDPGNEYGLGWINWEQIQGRIYHGHAGNVPGGTSTMWINESNDYALLISTNRYVFLCSYRAVKAWEGLMILLSNKVKEL
jgi:CubicO group peptidase (beta-lactamase class C family)